MNTPKHSTPEIATGNPERRRILFLDYLRSSAVLLVLWDHMVGQWLGWNQRSWIPLKEVDRFVAGPLAIIQDFGWLGVSLFFLISGFIITHVAVSETSKAFAIRRILRIYPPLIVAVLAAVAIVVMRHWLSVGDSQLHRVPSMPTSSGTLWSMTLLNWVQSPQPIVLGVAWTLAIEVIFYLFVFAVRPLLGRKGLGTWLILGVIALVLWSMRMHGANYFLFAASVSYVPLLMLGQILWLMWSTRITVWHGVLLSVAAWIEFVVGLERLQPTFLTSANSYGVSVAIAYGAFVLAMLMNDRFPQPRIALFLANRSYSLYLLHGPIALFVLDATIGRFGFTASLVLAAAALLLSTELCYQLVERPSQRLAKLLTRRTASRPQTVAPSTLTATVAAGDTSSNHRTNS
ncbi:acyltransferase family protein [Jatrophihabitans sp. DSM 45814]